MGTAVPSAHVNRTLCNPGQQRRSDSSTIPSGNTRLVSDLTGFSILYLKVFRYGNILEMAGTKNGKNVPPVKSVRQRYFDNPFPDYNGQPLPDASEYIEQALSLMQDIYSYYTVFPNRPRRDLYVGGAGVAYGCVRLGDRLPRQSADKELVLDLAIRIIDDLLQEFQSIPVKTPGVISGDFGVYVAAAIVYAKAGRSEDAEKALNEFVGSTSGVERMTSQGSSADEFMTGKCGYLAAFLELWKTFPDHPSLLEVPVAAIINSIIESGKQYSHARGFHSKCPLMYFHLGADYIGAAHGLSSILQILLCFPHVLKAHPENMKEIKASVDYLASCQKCNGNFGAVFNTIDQEDNELVQWCHGAPGVIMLFAKAYLVWNDCKYVDICRRCAEVIWKKGLLKKGPGLCHGISGAGYALLLMYRVTKEPEYLYRANCFADIMFQQSVRELSRLPDNPYSLFEGIAGTMCFYSDLTTPNAAFFPFLDVFFDCPVDFS